MNLPRLIIADEMKPGTVPPSLILVYVLRRSGIKVKVFTYARSELDMRLLKLLLGDTIISLDAYTCGSTNNLKIMFQRVAESDALNVILTPIGARQDEGLIQVAPGVTEIAKTLLCGIVPIISASASTILTVRTAMAVLSALENSYEGAALGVIFASVKNPREYQLLEQEYGRNTHTLSLGYIPKDVERALPSMQDVYNSAAGIMQIKSAALQLASALFHIEWQFLEAFGQLKRDWTSAAIPSSPTKNLKVAIIGGQALSLEGDNCRELFKFLGCSVIDYDPLRELFPKDAEVIYFPHSAANMYCDKLLNHEPFLLGIKQSFAANRLIFVNGASTPLFGQSFVTADGKKHDALGFFKFRGNYTSMKTAEGAKKIEARGTTNSIFTKNNEKIRGYVLDYLSISNPGNTVPPVWAYKDVRKNVELGSSGWVSGSCFVTDLHIELWSNIETVSRWLDTRKK